MNRILVLMAILGVYTGCLAVDFSRVTVPSVNFGTLNPPFMTQLPNGNIFLLGNNLGANTYEFDPVSFDLITRASIPFALYDDSCVITTSNGDIYALGGLLISGVAASANPFVQIYNPSLDKWSIGSKNMTTPRTRMACAYDSVKQNIHILGGFDQFQNLGAPHEVYSILNDTWTSPTNPANTHGRLGRGYYEPKSASIVFLGGAFTSAQSVYNTHTDQWTTWAPMPQQLYYFGLTVLADRVLAFGGAQLNYFLTYYIQNNTWTTQTMNTTLNFFHNTAVVGGSIYAMSSIAPSDLTLYVTYCQVPENCVSDCTNGCTMETGLCTPLNGLLCDDYDNCTIGDTCFGGQCVPGNQTAVECLPPVSPLADPPQVIDTPLSEPVAAPVQTTQPQVTPARRNVSQGTSLRYLNQVLVVLVLLIAM